MYEKVVRRARRYTENLFATSSTDICDQGHAVHLDGCIHMTKYIKHINWQAYDEIYDIANT
ncbi:MAG: hypothetical protein CVV02_08100 [Firmicutes bacterium HGW-Firmicutes-7]|nr:MAG: hypothetical protein CVV02_08100 [Firmicutes bacterium HGW-Firmicutes-7]